MPKEVIYPSVPERPDRLSPRAEVGWQPKCWVQLRIRDHGDELGGMCADLDREQINRLIRTLRKARDQAFGADA